MKHRADGPAMSGIGAFASSAEIEIIPVRGIDKELSAVPAGTTITVTCSAKFGVERTLAFAAVAVESGLHVIPHVAARQVLNEAHLRELVERLGALGVRDLFVIGGDAQEPVGNYASAFELLETLASFDHGLETIGVACYPEGHPKVSDVQLLEALRLKQSHASYMVNQLCFDPEALARWLGEVRALGIELPLRVGVAGPVAPRKLIDLSLKIGVGSSVRYLAKQHGLIGSVLRGGAYRPEELLVRLGTLLSSVEFGVEGLHLFSFNQVAAAVEWRHKMAASAPNWPAPPTRESA